MCFKYVFYAIIHGLAKDEFCANSVTLTMMDLSGVSSIRLAHHPYMMDFSEESPMPLPQPSP